MALTLDEIKWLHVVLRKVEFLSAMTVGELDQLATYISKKHYKKKATLFKQGDKGDFFYIIYNGSVSIWSSAKKGKKKHLATLSQGEYFGEMALLFGDPRNSTVIAEEDVDVFMLFKNDFNNLLRENASLGNKVQEVVNRRRAQRDLELSQKGGQEEEKTGFFRSILEHLGFS